MLDIGIETFRAFVVGIICYYLISAGKKSNKSELKGWRHLIIGFLLLFFGMCIDITDNFASLNKYVVIGDTEIQSILEKIVGYLLGFIFVAVGFWKLLPSVDNIIKTKQELQNAIEEIKTLKGIIPICSNCNKIRDDHGYWNLLESYIETHLDASFSHSMCPDCSEKLYGKEAWYIKTKKKKGIE